jgi:hypothetical protein
MDEDSQLPTEPDALRRMLRDIAGQPPRNPHLDNGPWDFLLRQSDVQIARLRPLLGELLTDSDESVRQQALAVLTNLPTDAKTIERLFEAARQTKLYQTPTLTIAMAQALSTFASQSKRAREAAALLRAIIGTRVPPAASATLFAQQAPDFAVESVARHGDAAPQFAAQVAAIFAGYQRDRLLPYLTSIASLSADTREDAWQRMQVFLGLSADRAAQLAEGVGLTPATGEPPTPEACRQALAL